ncbi:hypothetical protein OH77DRAFT_1427514 [Trametes cingulata]|nr:hypothetical protein OH77DRAFT_1427514 [Trametes cingulata]
MSEYDNVCCKYTRATHPACRIAGRAQTPQRARDLSTCRLAANTDRASLLPTRARPSSSSIIHAPSPLSLPSLPSPPIAHTPAQTIAPQSQTSKCTQSSLARVPSASGRRAVPCGSSGTQKASRNSSTR